MSCVGLFKYFDQGAFKGLLESIVEVKGGQIFWGSDDQMLEPLAFASTATVQAVYMKDPCYHIFLALGLRLSVPWINLFFQEDSFWEFCLRIGDKECDKFSVAPQEWDEDPAEIEAWNGHPEVLASVWDVPVDRIARYMVNWQPGTLWSDVLQQEAGGYRLRDCVKSHLASLRSMMREA